MRHPLPRRPVGTPARLLLPIALGTLAGCASEPEVIDDTPLLRSAIVTSEIRNNGFKGFFANEGIHVVRTVVDMQRVDDDFTYTGSLMGRFGGRRSRSEIVRLDKALEWQLDNEREQYTECALGGCDALATFEQAVYAEDAEEVDLDDDPENVCTLRTVESRFDIVRTGERREINGFPAEEYTVDWRHGVRDGDGRLGRNRISMTVWTTPETGEIAEAARMRRAFDERYRAALDERFPEQYHAAVPEAAAAVLYKYLLESLSDEDVAELERLMGEATPIEGYPVSRKIQWDSRNETCAAPPEEEADEEDRLDTRSLGGLLRSVGKGIVRQEIRKKREEKRREIELAPVFSIVEEVKSIEIGEIRESRLSVPPGYDLRNRR